MKINCVVVAVCLGLIPLVTASAAPVEQAFKFKAAVPDEDFTITPATPWPRDVTTLAYEPNTGAIETYSNVFTIMSRTNNVTAKLEKNARMTHGNNPRAAISVHVRLDGKLLNTNPQVVHIRGETPITHEIFIKPITDEGFRYPVGTYDGDVVLIFESI